MGDPIGGRDAPTKQNLLTVVGLLYRAVYRVLLGHSGLPEPYVSEHARLWPRGSGFMCHHLPYIVKQQSTSQ